MLKSEKPDWFPENPAANIFQRKRPGWDSNPQSKPCRDFALPFGYRVISSASRTLPDRERPDKETAEKIVKLNEEYLKQYYE